MLGGLVADTVLVLVVGLLIVLMAMGAGVWIWLRHRSVLSKKNSQPS